MSDDGKYPPGQGHAWRENWHERVLALLRHRGSSSLTEFARSMPLATLHELSLELGAGDVAAIQLQWLLVEEARVRGALRECALDLLVRALRGLKDGWPADSTWDGQRAARIALVRWQSCLEDQAYNSRLGIIVANLLNARDIPHRWRPGGADDPRLVSLFDMYWPRQNNGPNDEKSP